jgi:hypothetical protein
LSQSLARLSQLISQAKPDFVMSRLSAQLSSKRLGLAGSAILSQAVATLARVSEKSMASGLPGTPVHRVIEIKKIL